MTLSIRPLVAAALFALACGQTEAALITTTYNFSATDWFFDPPVPPVSTLEGSVTVTFDTSDTSLATRTTGITLNSLNVSLGSAIAFIYDPTGFITGVGLEQLLIGGVENSVGTVAPGTDDFSIVISNPSTNNPSLRPALLSTALPAESWRSETGTVSLVPVPATLALLGIGLAGLFAMRSRKSHC